MTCKLVLAVDCGLDKFLPVIFHIYYSQIILGVPKEASFSIPKLRTLALPLSTAVSGRKQVDNIALLDFISLTHKLQLTVMSKPKVLQLGEIILFVVRYPRVTCS
jgi:hypothetical protein